MNVFPESHECAGKKVYVVCYKCRYISGELKLSEEHNAYKWYTRTNFNEADDGTAYFGLLKKYFSSAAENN